MELVDGQIIIRVLVILLIAMSPYAFKIVLTYEFLEVKPAADTDWLFIVICVE